MIYFFSSRFFFIAIYVKHSKRKSQQEGKQIHPVKSS